MKGNKLLELCLAEINPLESISIRWKIVIDTVECHIFEHTAEFRVDQSSIVEICPFELTKCKFALLEFRITEALPGEVALPELAASEAPAACTNSHRIKDNAFELAVPKLAAKQSYVRYLGLDELAIFEDTLFEYSELKASLGKVEALNMRSHVWYICWPAICTIRSFHSSAASS